MDKIFVLRIQMLNLSSNIINHRFFFSNANNLKFKSTIMVWFNNFYNLKLHYPQ